ncbi:MAG: alanyl-tRNA editing protein [Lachnospiraceae bacterium]|nr:alanyl-tRNA editing protein [Lachnospiraceae bacterium]
MTVLLYNEDAYLLDFTANVLDCTPTKHQGKDAYDIVLDQTAFFPEQGGQDCDSGVIRVLQIPNDGNSVNPAGDDAPSNILHVSIKSDIIHHICDRPLPSDAVVKGLINREQRFDRMQQHSGEHLVSGTVHRYFGADNVGFHLSAREVTLDFNTTFEEKDIAFIEDIVNRAIYENFETHIFFPSPEELKDLNYRSKKEIAGQIRIVEFPGYDMCACCAPHVKRTGEIGSVRIVAAEHFKGGTRMWIECGARSLRSARAQLNDVRAISRITSAKISEIVPAVEKLSESLKDARFKLVKFERDSILALVDDIKAEKNPIIWIDSCDQDNLRMGVNTLVSGTDGFCSAFCGNDDDGYRFIIASSGNDCRELINKMKASFEIRGGGSADMVQGTIKATRTEIAVFYTETGIE